MHVQSGIFLKGNELRVVVFKVNVTVLVTGERNPKNRVGPIRSCQVHVDERPSWESIASSIIRGSMPWGSLRKS